MTNASEMAALVARLEISGADRTRWPAQERLRFAALIAGNAEARRLVAEATALDRLLDTMPAGDPGRLENLVDRIVAAAEAEGLPRAGNVVPISAAKRAPSPAARRPVYQRGNLQAAALLAASLFVGAFVGTSGVLNSAVPSLTGEYDVAEADITELLIDGNRASLLEDDTL